MPCLVDLYLLFLGGKVNCLQCNSETSAFYRWIWGRVKAKEERTDFREAGFTKWRLGFLFSSSSVTLLCNRGNLGFVHYSFFEIQGNHKHFTSLLLTTQLLGTQISHLCCLQQQLAQPSTYKSISPKQVNVGLERTWALPETLNEISLEVEMAGLVLLVAPLFVLPLPPAPP